MNKLRLTPSLYLTVERISYDIETCLRDYGGKLPVSLEALRGTLAQMALNSSLSVLPAKTKGAILKEEQSAHAAFVDYYFEATQRNMRMLGDNIRPLYGEDLDEDRCQREFAPRIAVTAEAGALNQAISQARANLQWAASAQSALFVLCGLASSSSMKADGPSPVDTMFATAREVLFQRMQQFEATYTRLVLVSGCPTTLQALRESIAVRHYGPGMAVEQLLTRGERLPGLSFGKQTEALRAEIAQAVAKPLQAERTNPQS